ncbi:LDLR chaperone boca-like [Antedon mediterranea]|uniref:LDLR chaperone boca-like n=1 Tax=Antedon mediterranea TaxID=105859 RepID=UPI003AF9C7DD
MRNFALYFTVLLAICLIAGIFAAEENPNNDKESKPAKKKKDIRDFNDADIERLFDEWEEGEEDTDEDDLPEHLREPPKVDFSKLDTSNPENMVKMTKKGKTLMVFVTVSGKPEKQEAEEITQLWQNQLFQANFQLQRYMVSDERAIFMVTDGSTAFDIKNFLIEQERCYSVSIDQQEYFGRGSDKYEGKTNKKAEKKKDKKKDKKKKDKKKSDGKDGKKKDEDKSAKKKKDKKEKKSEENKIKKTKDRNENLINPDDEELSTKTNKAKKAKAKKVEL